MKETIKRSVAAVAVDEGGVFLFTASVNTHTHTHTPNNSSHRWVWWQRERIRRVLFSSGQAWKFNLASSRCQRKDLLCELKIFFFFHLFSFSSAPRPVGSLPSLPFPCSVSFSISDELYQFLIRLPELDVSAGCHGATEPRSHRRLEGFLVFPSDVEALSSCDWLGTAVTSRWFAAEGASFTWLGVVTRLWVRLGVAKQWRSISFLAGVWSAAS